MVHVVSYQLAGTLTRSDDLPIANNQASAN